MDWARIMAPLSGGEGDARALAAAASVAEAFDAEIAGVFAPADVSDLMPWMGDAYSGAVQPSALDSLRQAAAAGEASARSMFAQVSHPKKTFIALESPVWASLAMEARLSDLIVFDDAPARGRGRPGRHLPADRRRGTASHPGGAGRAEGRGPRGGGVGWREGGEPGGPDRHSPPGEGLICPDPQRPSRFPQEIRSKGAAALPRGARRGLGHRGSLRYGRSRAQPLRAAKSAGANLLVAGAFGHPRLREFIFGGATRTFLNAEAPSLFLSH